MAIVAYLWMGNHYCPDCIVDSMTDHDPWAQWWNATDQQSTDPEVNLNSIAAFFEIDRDDAHAVALDKFPVPLTVPPYPPSLCSKCLHWFTQTDERSSDTRGTQ